MMDEFAERILGYLTEECGEPARGIAAYLWPQGPPTDWRASTAMIAYELTKIRARGLVKAIKDSRMDGSGNRVFYYYLTRQGADWLFARRMGTTRTSTPILRECGPAQSAAPAACGGPVDQESRT